MSADSSLAPWNPEEVEALNLYQQARFMHPFTCGRRGGHHQGGDVLVATPAGWVCPARDCDFTQGWAHPFMADLEWVTTTAARHRAMWSNWGSV